MRNNASFPERTLNIVLKKSQATISIRNQTQAFLARNWQYLVIAALSLLAFVLIYGYRIINPAYTDWLMGKGDLSQHYIGWQAFKNGSWLFPIGMTDQLAYPSHTSIIFTDSIPLFAVFFKLFRAILPTEFQYFGLWGILCFVLQGIFAVRLIQRFVPNRLYVILTSMLFVITPVMIFRMYMHTALAGQWLILFALDTFFENKTAGSRTIYLRWAVLGLLCASTHLYFLLMCGIILAGCCLEDVIRTRKLTRAIIIALCYLLVSLVTVALLGGFSSSMDAANGGLGIFSWNLNSLINSQGWSRFLPGLPTYGVGQYEGFAYLGAGVFCLLALSLLAIAVSPKIRASIRARSSEVIALCAVFLVALVASVSPLVTLNDRLLFTISLPQFAEDLWAIFRATGRIGWIMVYLIMLGTVIISYRWINRRGAVVIAALVLCLQGYDMHEQLVTRHEEFSHSVVYQSLLAEDAFWNGVIQQNKVRHVVLLQRFMQVPEAMKWSLSKWAMDNRLTLNDFYFARDNTVVFRKNWDAPLANPDASELIIMTPDNALETTALDLFYYRVDGLIVGSFEPIPGQASIDITGFSSSRYTFGDHCVIRGEDRAGARYLNAEGKSYGPYWSLPQGTYQLVVKGNNLSHCDVGACSFSGEIHHAVSALSVQDDQISFIVTVEENTFTFEVTVENESDEDVRLDYIEFTRLG